MRSLGAVNVNIESSVRSVHVWSPLVENQGEEYIDDNGRHGLSNPPKKKNRNHPKGQKKRRNAKEQHLKWNRVGGHYM